jgi:hypothetical protein
MCKTKKLLSKRLCGAKDVWGSQNFHTKDEEVEVVRQTCKADATWARHALSMLYEPRVQYEYGIVTL